MGSAAEAEAAAGAAAAAPAPTPKDNKKVWPKRRDMCDMNDKNGASIGSPRRSQLILNSSWETRYCSHSQKFTVFDLVFCTSGRIVMSVVADYIP